MSPSDRRPSGIAQDQAFQRFRKEYDVDRMMIEQRDNTIDGQRRMLVALAVAVVLAVVLALVGSSGGAAFMVMVAAAFAMVWGILALARRFS